MSRILLVEDDPDVRLLMEHILLDAGYEVDVAGSMTGGGESLGRRSYALVIADGRLPDGNGMAVADKAREEGVKALVVTGYALSLPVEVIDRFEILLKPLRPRRRRPAAPQILVNARSQRRA
jgi:DNA-binding NtrC family response regulator